MMNDEFIQVTNLSKIYEQADLKTTALSGLTMTIAQGAVAAIIGPSGSGKTTLLNILGGLDRPTAGTITIGQIDLTALPAESLVRYRRYVVGFVWQQTVRNMLPYLTARQNVMLPMKLGGLSRREQRTRAETLLADVGMTAHAGQYTSALSGGEQQRVAIAIALANNPGLLLADEPTGAVDTQTTATLVALFRRLAARYGVTVIIVTHDPDVSAYVDQTIVIKDGHN